MLQATTGGHHRLVSNNKVLCSGHLYIHLLRIDTFTCQVSALQGYTETQANKQQQKNIQSSTIITTAPLVDVKTEKEGKVL